MRVHKRRYTYAAWEYEMFEWAIKREHYKFNLPAALEWAQVQHTKSHVLSMKTQ